MTTPWERTTRWLRNKRHRRPSTTTSTSFDNPNLDAFAAAAFPATHTLRAAKHAAVRRARLRWRRFDVARRRHAPARPRRRPRRHPFRYATASSLRRATTTNDRAATCARRSYALSVVEHSLDESVPAWRTTVDATDVGGLARVANHSFRSTLSRGGPRGASCSGRSRSLTPSCGGAKCCIDSRIYAGLDDGAAAAPVATDATASAVLSRRAAWLSAATSSVNCVLFWTVVCLRHGAFARARAVGLFCGIGRGSSLRAHGTREGARAGKKRSPQA